MPKGGQLHVIIRWDVFHGVEYVFLGGGIDGVTIEWSRGRGSCYEIGSLKSQDSQQWLSGGTTSYRVYGPPRSRGSPAVT